MPETPTFGRYAEIPYDEMTPEQQEGYRFLVEVRGAAGGPSKIWVHNPKLVKASAPLGAHFHPGGYSLSEREREIAVIIINSKWHSAYPTAAHERRGKEVGLPADKVEACSQGCRRPSRTSVSKSSTKWRSASRMRDGPRKDYTTARSRLWGISGSPT
jgi:4-carboxymuconolactone decarboxylase